jgi:hypothetical protein
LPTVASALPSLSEIKTKAPPKEKREEKEGKIQAQFAVDRVLKPGVNELQK